jgi:hypothetical protein
MHWTTETPSEPGFYLWRFSPSDEPPVLEPFLIYDLFGTLRVQELSQLRDHGERGSWTWSEWNWRVNEPGAFYPTEYLHLGPLTMNIALVRAFRELYHSAVSAYRDLCWTPDLSDNGHAVMVELMAAINEIHKETK